MKQELNIKKYIIGIKWNIKKYIIDTDELIVINIYYIYKYKNKRERYYFIEIKYVHIGI